MVKFVALDNVKHAKVRIDRQYGTDTGDTVNQVLVFPTEFQDLQREYPIFFRQSPEKKYYAVVLLGLEKDENLFLDQEKWTARYIPGSRDIGPFALARAQNGVADAGDQVILIDMEHPSVNTESGQALFLPAGGYSPYLESVLQLLRKLQHGADVVEGFFAELVRFDLIEPITLELNASETERLIIPDLFTINREKLTTLSAEALHTLNGLGLLEHCYAILASVGNMKHLIDMKAQRIG